MGKMMMFRAVLAAGCLLASGCGESKPPPSEEHVRMAKACIAEGGEAAHCECEATKVDELLTAGAIDPAIYTALILQAEGKSEEADALLQTLPYDKQFEQPSLVGEAKLECVTAS